jgi:hypothetical protein
MDTSAADVGAGILSEALEWCFASATCEARGAVAVVESSVVFEAGDRV